MKRLFVCFAIYWISVSGQNDNDFDSEDGDEAIPVPGVSLTNILWVPFQNVISELRVCVSIFYERKLAKKLLAKC